MDYTIHHADSFPLLECGLQRGETMLTEAHALVAMSAALDVRGVLRGGFVRNVLRNTLSRERGFFQEIAASRGAGRLLMAPQTPGGMEAVTMDGGRGLVIQKNGFVACASGVQVEDAGRGLLRGLFSGTGFPLLRLSGQGVAFVSGWGAVHAIPLGEGEEYAVENSHLAAWSEGMRFTVKRAGRAWFSSMASGEAIVCLFRGPGLLLVQTRSRPRR
jgi:uncharacterized protein (TIGR00266 family)